MKRMLITGKGSYIGTSFIKHMEHYPEEYQVDELDVRGEVWKNFDFSTYDAILHVAGIAHVDTNGASDEMKKLYYTVNADLANDVANKAKYSRVKQFILLSSIIVYGESDSLEPTTILQSTQPAPNGFYGDSKLQAENKFSPLSDESFNVAILRLPMVYGAGCKGSFSKLEKFAKVSFVFPDMSNRRSMIYIGNLCRTLRFIVDNQCNGIFFPQIKEYVCTTEMVKLIAEASGKRIHTTRIFNGLIRKLSKHVRIINKVFGTLIYGEDLSTAFEDVEYISLSESIEEICRAENHN